MAEQSILERRLGAQLRALRLERGLSVRTLAARSGFSPSFISNIESETVSPSIGSLEKIATALGVTLSQLFGALEASPRRIVRRQERTQVTSAWSRSTANLLTDAAVHRKLSIVELVIDAGGASGTQTTASQDTILVVLSGALTLVLEEETVELTDGDTAYLQRGDSFTWRNGTPNQVVVLVVGGTEHSNVMSDLLPGKQAGGTSQAEA
jgi:transcriptional regulator with XRE-family HTH domain